MIGMKTIFKILAITSLIMLTTVTCDENSLLNTQGQDLNENLNAEPKLEANVAAAESTKDLRFLEDNNFPNGYSCQLSSDCLNKCCHIREQICNVKMGAHCMPI